MKFLAILSILFISNAHALNNQRVEVSASDDMTLHQTNNANIEAIDKTNKEMAANMDKYKTCLEQDLIYLGIEASNVDADGCYDLAATANPAASFRPTYAGVLSNKRSFLSGSANYNSNYTGRFTADIKCNDQFPGSRALTYDDIKYVKKTMQDPSNIGDSPIWVYDSVLSFYDAAANSVTSKNLDTVTNFNDCNGWGTSNASHRGKQLQRKTNGSNPDYLGLETPTCDTAAYIACVYN